VLPRRQDFDGHGDVERVGQGHHHGLDLRIEQDVVVIV
jgi:hypothetical protein